MKTATCAGCARKWHTYAERHCGGCHRQFTGTRTFDMHHPLTDGRCSDPAAMIRRDGTPRLVPVKRHDGTVWAEWHPLGWLTPRPVTSTGGLRRRRRRGLGAGDGAA